MKYIDADLLRKEIDHRIDILADVSIKCAKNDDMEMHNYYHGKAISLDELLSFIDSLQQEFPTTDKSVKEFLATHPKVEVPEKYKTPDFVFKKQVQQEQPEVDLEKEYKTWWNSITGKINVEHMMEWYMHETARHFYELGLNARKED